MEGTRAPQGLDAEDRIALGLGAAHLFYLVIFSMSGWAILSTPLPLLVRGPVGVVVIFAGALLAWGRFGGRPLDRWIILYAAFRARPRTSASGVDEMTVDTSAAAAADAELHLAASTPGSPTEPPTGTARAARRARRVAFYSQSGGSGKTALAFETATLLAVQSGARVALVDLDCVSSSLRVRSGLEGLGMTDLMAATTLDEATLESVLLRHPGGCRIVHGTSGDAARPRLGQCVAAMLDHLDASGYEVVVFDLATAALEHHGDLAGALVGSLDAVYCVFNPTPGSVFGLYRAVAALRMNGLRSRVRLVLNRHDVPISLDEIRGDLRLDVLASVATLSSLAGAERTHVAAVLEDEGVADAVYPIAEDIYPDMSARWFQGAERGRQLTAGLP